jgi:hypothetical protein
LAATIERRLPGHHDHAFRPWHLSLRASAERATKRAHTVPSH